MGEWKQINESRVAAAVGPLLFMVAADGKQKGKLWKAEVRIRDAIPDRVLWYGSGFKSVRAAQSAAVLAGKEVLADALAALDGLLAH